LAALELRVDVEFYHRRKSVAWKSLGFGKCDKTFIKVMRFGEIESLILKMNNRAMVSIFVLNK
jgi:hypothetical protein